MVKITCEYETSKINAAKLTGNVVLTIANLDNKAHDFNISDKSYKAATKSQTIASGSSVRVVLDLSKNYSWYDFSVKLNGHNTFEERFAGRVETGLPSKTDPLMGGIV